MKLFLYDEKHENIIAEQAIGPIDEKEEEAMDIVIQFLEQHDILNRYKRLVLANSWTREPVLDDDGSETGFSEIVFA